MALLFIHGVGAGSAVSRLQLRHFKCSTALELPGYPLGKDLGGVDDYARIVSNYIKHHSMQHPILEVHSMRVIALC